MDYIASPFNIRYVYWITCVLWEKDNNFATFTASAFMPITGVAKIKKGQFTLVNTLFLKQECDAILGLAGLEQNEQDKWLHKMGFKYRQF